MKRPALVCNGLLSRRSTAASSAILADGSTRLVGTTWYSNRMWPAAYWSLWSGSIIHRIHGRVLTHIKQLAEAPPPLRGKASPE